MNLTALEISKKFNGKVEGDQQITIRSLARIEDAEAGSISFLANQKYTSFLSKSKASIVLITEGIKVEEKGVATLIYVKDAYAAFTQLLIEWAAEKNTKKEDIHATAVVHPSTQIGKGVYVGPFVSIGADCILEDGVQINAHCALGDRVQIKRNTVLHQRVSILDDSEIGTDCILHSGAVIGSDGFGFAPQKEKAYIKIPQQGKVLIGNHVEIGANSTVDRATLGATIIHDGVKLDNLVQIAHNVEIGSHTVIASQTGIAGSSKVGSYCVIGGQVGIVGHITIEDGVQIQGQTGVIQSVKKGSSIQGTPAFDYKSFYKSYALFKRFPEIESRVSRLEKKK
jgi:UDP-3-O-[3-hydroxymyristoyl] glucosamine N-acyltransferase